MEDRQLPIVLGQGAGARTVTLDLPRVHARRRDHPRRPADDAASRPLRRLASASSTTSPTTWPRSSRRSAGILEVEIEPEGERRDRRALAGHAAGRQPAAEAGPRLRPGPRRGRDHRRGRRRGARPARGRRRPASTATTARSWRRSRSSSPAARSASRPSPRRSTRSRRRSRTSTSPTCSSRA